jgi:hypothetical protein
MTPVFGGEAYLAVAGLDNDTHPAILTSVCTGTTVPRVHVIVDNVLTHVA